MTTLTNDELAPRANLMKHAIALAAGIKAEAGFHEALLTALLAGAKFPETRTPLVVAMNERLTLDAKTVLGCASKIQALNRGRHGKSISDAEFATWSQNFRKDLEHFQRVLEFLVGVLDALERGETFGEDLAEKSAGVMAQFQDGMQALRWFVQPSPDDQVNPQAQT